MGIKQQQKGKRGATEIAKIFREQFSDAQFDRRKDGVPGSDLLVPDWFDYAVECKNEASLRVKHLFKPTKELIGFWNQTSAQADALDKLPLLVCKIEGLIFACEEWGSWQLLSDWIISYRKRRAGAR